MKFLSRHPDERTLSLLAGRDLRGPERYFARRHVQRCEACRATVEDYVRTRDLVAREASLPEVDFAALKHRVRVAVEHERGASPAGAGRRRQAVAAVLASAIIVVAALLRMAGVEFSRPEAAVTQIGREAEPLAVPFDRTRAQITSDGNLSMRVFHEGSGTMTITDYYAP